ncbi:ccdc135 [Symbiodinium microadriaticum]|nr:ccdc135 [Symbiodinium microadriaticum]
MVAASELLAFVAAGGEQEPAELAVSPTDMLCSILRKAAEPHVRRSICRFRDLVGEGGLCDPCEGNEAGTGTRGSIRIPDTLSVHTPLATKRHAVLGGNCASGFRILRVVNVGSDSCDRWLMQPRGPPTGYWRRSTRLLPWRATRTERSARRNRFAAHCVMPVRPATTFSAALSSVCDHAGYTPALAQAADAAALVEIIRETLDDMDLADELRCSMSQLATGDTFRRLVSRTLAAALTPMFDEDVAPALVPFVHLFYGQASEYTVGDPLAPALFVPGQHDGLRRTNAAFRVEGEALMAFLDDLYIVLLDPARAREAIDVVTGCVEAHTGIAANRGKTRGFNFEGGPAPPRVAELGPDVWRGDKPLAEHGFIALGSPIGTAEYTQAWGTDRLEMEEALLRQLAANARVAWLLLRCWAAPRANHVLRTTIPPTLSRAYTAAHDVAVCGTLQVCLGEPADDVACPARDIALLPIALLPTP